MSDLRITSAPIPTARRDSNADEEPEALFERDDGTLVVRLTGTWSLDAGLPSTSALEAELVRAPAARRVIFETGELDAWDSALVTFVFKVLELCRIRAIPAERGGLPAGLNRLLDLAAAAETAPRPVLPRPGLLARIGQAAVSWVGSVNDALNFVGEFTLALLNLLRGRARYQLSDLVLIIEQCGADALGIVSLISFLVG